MTSTLTFSISAPSDGSSVGTSSFTITHSPSSPFIGEVVRTRIEGSGGHTIANPLLSSSNVLADLWLSVDVGESGASFENGVDQDAETAYGRLIGHAYTTAGAKTQTVDSWSFGGDRLSQTHSITVVDPDTYSWDRILWVDFTGDTTGMPTADSTNIRVTSYSQWLTYSSSFSGQDVRMRFRGSTTHNITSSGFHRISADLMYVDSFGTGKATIRSNIGASVETTFMQTATADQRVVFSNLIFDGGWNKQTGEFTRGVTRAIFINSSSPRATVSVWRCEAEGMREFLSGAGSSSNNQLYNVSMVDCTGNHNNNYGLMYSGPSNEVVVRGCKSVQDLNTGRGDDRYTDGGVQNPEFADHAAVRIPRFVRASFNQNDVRVLGGWSSTGTGRDRAAQPPLRLYYDQNISGTYAMVIGNNTQGRGCIAWGRDTVGSDTMTNASECLFVGNKHFFNGQAQNLVTQDGGGLIAYSNTGFAPNLSMDITGGRPMCVTLVRDQGDNADNTTTAVRNQPNYIGFNTLISRMTSDRAQYNSGQSPNTITAFALDSNFFSGSTVGATDFTSENNLLSGDGLTTSGTTAFSAFSTPSLQPITSGAADSSVITGPPVDVDLTRRTASTNIGAHHSTAASSSASAPTNSVVPTIESMSAWTDRAGISSLGTWANLDDVFTAIEYNWELDGAAISDTHHPNPSISGLSGDLTCDIVLSTYEGSRVSATSNTVSLS